MTLAIETRVSMNHGGDIPVFGLGVYAAGAGAGTRDAVAWALESGYRHIDTASFYGNEKEVGDTVRESGIARENIFVTTKLWNSDHGYDNALRAFDQSLARLGMDYVDLYLIHWPVEGLRGESWRALEKILEQGRARAIGVSNYTVRHLEELLAGCNTVPAVNQVEFSPFLYQRDLFEWCRDHDIVLEAYSPLAKGQILQDGELAKVAERNRRTPAQILIRWALQRGLVVIPKSSNRERIRENAAVFDFELSSGDMAELDALDRGYRSTWDPTEAP
jgi:diketogulonate reductase-like aldo/keto reductase